MNMRTTTGELLKFKEVERWLTGRTKGTKHAYLSAMKAYVEFRGLNPKELIDEIEEDRKKSQREQGTPELWLNKFYEWLTTQYAQKSRGAHRKRRANGKIGISSTLADSYCMAIRGFYKKNGFSVKGELINIPEPVEKEANSKLRLRQPEVNRLLNVAGCVRDRAIILLQYQSFQGVSEVCKLNYGHVQRALESGENFILVQSVRKKRKVKYHFVIGPEVVELLKIYLDERQKSGEILRYDSPLFIQERQRSKNLRITVGAIESMMVTVALKSGLVTGEQMKIADLNPCRPHALRSSGMTVAKLSGMPEVAVEYMAGHKLDRTTQAYWQTNLDELLELYKKHYHALRVLKPTIDEAKIKELETRVLKRDDLIDRLLENSKMKDEKIEQLEAKISEMAKRIERFDNFQKKYSWFFERLDEELRIMKENPPSKPATEKEFRRKNPWLFRNVE
jgi:integrase